MNTYTVYSHPDGHSETKFRSDEAIKHGFSWTAFFFTWWWALLSGLLVQFFIVVGWAGLLFAVGSATGGGTIVDVIFVSGLALMPIYGWYGNKWRTDSLRKRGYQAKGTVEASSGKKAKGIVEEKA